MNKLIKRSKGLQAQIIQDWAPENKQIIIAHYERKIATFFDAEDKNEQFQNLHTLMVKWAVLTGVRPLPLKDETKLFVEYISEHFYRLSIMEIDNAFKLATSGSLDIDAEHYQSFSVIYISKIINSYKRYIGKYILDYQNQLDEQETKVDSPSEDEKLKLLIESILENFENFKKDPSYNHFGYISYDFLKNLGLIEISPEEKEIILVEARKLAIEQLNEIKRSKFNEGQQVEKETIRLQIIEVCNDKSGGQELVIRICKNLGLSHYFEYILKNNLSLGGEIAKSIKNG